MGASLWQVKFSNILLKKIVFFTYIGRIKWSNRFYEIPQDVSVLIQFCKANQFTVALITTIDKAGTKKISAIDFTSMPACVYVYNIGENTVRMKATN